jgi:hypothetical protein
MLFGAFQPPSRDRAAPPRRFPGPRTKNLLASCYVRRLHLWLKSSKQLGEISTAEVLRLRATGVVSRDKSVRRSAQRLSGKSSGNIVWSWKRRGRVHLENAEGVSHFPTTLRRLLFQHGQARACFCACDWRISRAFALSRTKSLCATAMRTTLGGLLAVRRRFSMAMKSGS